jgi:hypothetical protein
MVFCLTTAPLTDNRFCVCRNFQRCTEDSLHLSDEGVTTSYTGQVCIRWSKDLNSSHDPVFIFHDEKDNPFLYTIMTSGRNNTHFPVQPNNTVTLSKRAATFSSLYPLDLHLS